MSAIEAIIAEIPEIVPALLQLLGLLRNTKDEHARRAALDAALAAAEAEVMRRRYPT